MQMDFSPLFEKIDALCKVKEQVIVAIDGNCAAGKTTLAALLKDRYDCNVFHMDDFFLRPVQRTAERLEETGGNVDYERFKCEVLEPLKMDKPFFYQPYDCRTQTFREKISVMPRQLNIIEGSYSLHPYFGEVYDLKVFLKIELEMQNRRLAVRNPQLYDRFINEWAPMENRYFTAFGIEGKCNFVFEVETP